MNRIRAGTAEKNVLTPPLGSQNCHYSRRGRSRTLDDCIVAARERNTPMLHHLDAFTSQHLDTVLGGLPTPQWTRVKAVNLGAESITYLRSFRYQFRGGLP